MALAAALLALVAGCRRQSDVEAITLVVPDGSGRTIELVPRSAFAEHVELPELGHELRVTLASYEIGCEKYAPPGSDDTALFLTLRTPAGRAPAAGSYTVTAMRALDAGAPDSGPAGDSDARTTKSPALTALVRGGGRGYVLRPGGQLELGEVNLDPGGRVRGTLALEFPGTADQPASSARGRFEARLCRPRGSK